MEHGIFRDVFVQDADLVDALHHSPHLGDRRPGKSVYFIEGPPQGRRRPPWLVVLGVRQIPGLAATDCLLFGSEEALDDLRQHRLDGERVVGGVRHDC